MKESAALRAAQRQAGCTRTETVASPSTILRPRRNACRRSQATLCFGWLVSPLSRAHLFALSGLVAGCTTILGVDDHYSAQEQAVSGGTGGTRPNTDGSAGVGGSTGATGGVAGGGGGGAGGSGGTSNPCAADEKPCSFPTEGGVIEQCVKPSPLVGCSMENCTPCDGAPNADPSCNGVQCSLQCTANFEPCQGRCEPVGTCGAGGTGGSGGTGGVSGTSGTGGSAGTGGTIRTAGAMSRRRRPGGAAFGDRKLGSQVSIYCTLICRVWPVKSR